MVHMASIRKVAIIDKTLKFKVLLFIFLKYIIL